MSAGASPMAALQAAMLMKRLAEGAPGMGGAGADTSEAKGSQLQQSFSSLQSADPDMAGKTLEKIQQLMGPLYMSMIQQVPDAASHIANAQKAINQARKAIQQAAATLNAVRPQIANSAGMPPGMPQAPQMGNEGGL